MKQNGVDKVSTIHCCILHPQVCVCCESPKTPPLTQTSFVFLKGVHHKGSVATLRAYWPVSVPRRNSRMIFAELPHEDFQAIQAGNLGRSKVEKLVEHRHQNTHVDNPVPRNNVYMVDQRTCWYNIQIIFKQSLNTTWRNNVYGSSRSVVLTQRS